MKPFIREDYVTAILAANGSLAMGVEFVKKDGTVTARGGLPKVHKRRIGGEAGARQAQTLRDHGLAFFDYADPDGNREGKRGFSFKKSRVTQINAMGEEITAENAAEFLAARYVESVTQNAAR